MINQYLGTCAKLKCNIIIKNSIGLLCNVSLSLYVMFQHTLDY